MRNIQDTGQKAIQRLKREKPPVFICPFDNDVCKKMNTTPGTQSVICNNCENFLLNSTGEIANKPKSDLNTQIIFLSNQLYSKIIWK